MRLKSCWKTYASIFILAILLILPIILGFMDGLFKRIGFPEIVPMSVGEYSVYVGTVIAIVWAIQAFSIQKRDHEQERIAKEKTEQPQLFPIAIQSDAVLVRNEGPFPAINLTNCDEPVADILGPNQSVLFIWSESEGYEDLIDEYPDAKVSFDPYLVGTNGISLELFAYSKSGKLWEYNVQKKNGEGLRVTITEA